jgi:hypothetical protein
MAKRADVGTASVLVLNQSLQLSPAETIDLLAPPPSF